MDYDTAPYRGPTSRTQISKSESLFTTYGLLTRPWMSLHKLNINPQLRIPIRTLGFIKIHRDEEFNTIQQVVIHTYKVGMTNRPRDGAP